MTDNKKEEVDLQEEILRDEERVEDLTNEEIKQEEKIEETVEEKVSEYVEDEPSINKNLEEDYILQEDDFTYDDKITLSDIIRSNLIDIVSTGIMAVAAMFIFDVLMRAIAGLYISDKMGMFGIFYIVISFIYRSIMEYKKGTTIGKKFVNIKISK